MRRAILTRRCNWSHMQGDRRGLGVIRVNYAQLLFEMGKTPRSLEMAWHGLVEMTELGYGEDAAGAQGLIRSMRQQLGDAEFDTLWRESIHDPQPGWL
ncbi:MAG: hypothetical protein HC802_04075 [Caldilineaceae bacterium]|nr:hypothetical protein [Caldilineaceae bacterium]